METCHVRVVPSQTILPLRTRVLRPNFWPDTLARYTEEDLETTIHLGAFLESVSEPVGCATFMLDPSPITGNMAVRLRGMASDPELRGKGVGRALLEKAMREVLPEFYEQYDGHLWFNARTGAQGFYERLGFVGVGDVFDIDPIGPHIIMWGSF